MKILFSGVIPFKGFTAVNLFGVLFVRKERKNKLTEKLIVHETIHTKQMQEMLYVFFYLWYFTEWLIKLFLLWNGHKAYRSISFEREAYEHENDKDYLLERKHFNWIYLI